MNGNKNGIQHIKVLLVEDDPATVDIIREVVKLEKYLPITLEAYGTLTDALKALESRLFDLVLLDPGLPDSEGEQTVLRMLNAVSGIPVIVLTGRNEMEFARWCIESGAMDYLVKGVGVEKHLPLIIYNAVARTRVHKRDADMRNILENVADGILAVNRQGKVLFCNTAAEKLLGYPATELIGTSFGYPIGSDTPLEIDLPRRTGGPGTAEMRATETILDGEDCYIIAMRDITEQKNVLEALQESETLFRNLFQSHFPVQLIVDPDTEKIIYANKAAAEFYGIDQEALKQIHKSDISLTTPEENEQNIKDIAAGKLTVYESRHKLADGSICDVEVFGRKIEVSGKELLHLVVHDITARKQAEKEKREKEKNYKNLVERIPGVIYSYSDKKGGLYYSSQVESILGYSPAYLYDHPHIWHDSIHPEDLQKVNQTIKSSLETKIFDLEYRIKDRHGKWHWFRDRSIDVRNEDGETVIDGLAMDITDRKSAELEITRSFDRQKVVNSLLSISLGGIELDDILDQVLEAVLSMPWLSFQSQGCIFLIEDDPNVLVMKATRGLNNQCRTECAQLPAGKCLCGLAASTGEIQYSDHIDERHEIYFDDMSPHGHYCVPILHEDNTIGVINIFLKEGHPRDETEEEFLSAIANTLASIITRKRNEEELIKLSTAVEQSGDSILITDRRGIIEYVNPAFERLTGYSKEEVIGKTPSIVKSGKHDDMFYKKLWETILSGKVFRSVLTNKKKNGELYFSANTITPIKDAHGNFSRFVATARDITELVNAEEALRKSEENYRTLFEDSRDLIFVSTPDGKLIDINPAGVELFGYSSKEEILNANIAKDHYINPADREKYIQTLEKYGFVRDYELRLKNKNGEELIILETSTAHKDKDGNIVAYRGIMRDITQEKRLREQLIQSQKMEALGVLAGGIAHDFNNILTTILGSAQLGLMKITPDNPLYKRFADIEKGAHRAADLTKQILAFSRKQELEPRVIDLNELIRNFSRMMNRLIGENIEAKIITTEKTCPVMADPNALEQVLMNFAVNARDAMPDGGTLTITTKRVSPDDKLKSRYPDLKSDEYVLISVSDTGIGIPDEILSRIFEPFFTTKETGKGTGLGLSVVHGIIKQHNGVIDVQSEINKGTVFRIFLPSTKIVSEKTDEKVTEKIPRGIETILFADNEASIRKVARQSLEALGYTVLLAEDGEMAVEMFTGLKQKIDLAIIDVIMPGIGGMGAYEKIRKISPDIPIIFLTGSTDMIKEFDREMADIDLLQKPFTIESLGKMVREVLDRR